MTAARRKSDVGAAAAAAVQGGVAPRIARAAAAAAETEMHSGRLSAGPSVVRGPSVIPAVSGRGRAGGGMLGLLCLPASFLSQSKGAFLNDVPAPRPIRDLSSPTHCQINVTSRLFRVSSYLVDLIC